MKPATLTSQEVQQRITDTFVQKVTLIGPYVNKRSPVKLRCEECGYEWECPAASVLYGTNHNCPNCNRINRKNGQIVKCAYCGKEIYRSLHQLQENKSGYFYCSKLCGNRHKNMLREQRGEWKNCEDYRAMAFKYYPHKCAICGWDEDGQILEAHHIDENRKNNDINNLMLLCPICHRKLTSHRYQLIDNCLVKIK